MDAAVLTIAITRAGFTQVKIPPRSPDINPIENLFPWAKRRLRGQALLQGIRNESFSGFQKRVVATLMGAGREFVDRLILSLPERLKAIVAGKGERIQY